LSEVYAVIEDLSAEYSVVNLCRVLEVSRSAYYAYYSGTTYVLQGQKQWIADEVRQVFEFHKRRYGSRRIREELLDKGWQVGRHQVTQRMKEQGLVAIQPKRFVPKTTKTHPHLRRSPNLLLEADNQALAPNEVIVGDITYLPNERVGSDKWLYLAVWLDLFSRRIVGWKVDDNMEEQLVITAFGQVLRHRAVAPGLIVHSDGGGQYGSNAFRELLAAHQFRQSMTRKDNHYDNAHAESLFSRFKAELLTDTKFHGLQDAYYQCFEYIEGYYNTIRKHSSIGYLSPIQFEEKFWAEHGQ